VDPAFKARWPSSQTSTRLFTQIKREKGKLDIVFANAGVVELAPVGEITEEQFDRIFDINVKGLLFTVQKALPLIPVGGINHLERLHRGVQRQSCVERLQRDQGRGAVVRAHVDDGFEGTKIRVNALSPGPINTPAYDRLAQSGPAGQQMLASIVNRVPMGRFGTPG